MTKRPRWLETSDRTLWPTLEFAIRYFDRQVIGSAELDSVPYAAALHLSNCLALSQKANESVSHAVAMALARQCVEAITVIDAGLQESEVAQELLSRWLNGKATSGQLRSELEKMAWPRYGTGLWNESWCEFFANLARAVQPFAHYGVDLMQWQMAVRSRVLPGSNGSNVFLAQLGGFDPEKASLVTLLHSLIGWAVARVFSANSVALPLADRDLDDLTQALASCEYLERDVTDWSRQFWPHVLEKETEDKPR